MVNVESVPEHEPLRIVLGAGDQAYPGWISTGKEQLDLLRREDSCRGAGWQFSRRGVPADGAGRGLGPAGHPAAGHQIVYDFERLSDVFGSAGFEVDLLEYCDADGRFHYHQWDPDQGPIYRSLLSDPRNEDGRLGFVSLILDARKPVAS